MKVATVEEMRQLDRRAIEKCGIPDHILMENAGEAVYYAIREEFGVRDRSFAVICGLGNNGGDGFVVARKIQSSGGEAIVFVLGDPDKVLLCSGGLAQVPEMVAPGPHGLVDRRMPVAGAGAPADSHPRETSGPPGYRMAASTERPPCSTTSSA